MPYTVAITNHLFGNKNVYKCNLEHLSPACKAVPVPTAHSRIKLAGSGHFSFPNSCTVKKENIVLQPKHMFIFGAVNFITKDHLQTWEFMGA
jgi:hypothetical protein